MMMVMPGFHSFIHSFTMMVMIVTMMMMSAVCQPFYEAVPANQPFRILRNLQIGIEIAIASQTMPCHFLGMRPGPIVGIANFLFSHRVQIKNTENTSHQP